MGKLLRWILIVPLILVGLFLLIQLVPYGKAQANPPVVRDFPWPDDQAHRAAQKACYDCHSNETIWPWYSRIAPFSWLVWRDVEEGRQKLNFSEWGQGAGETDDLVEVVQQEEMPPRGYILLHPQASLDVTEQNALIAALAPYSGEAGEGEEDEEQEDD